MSSMKPTRTTPSETFASWARALVPAKAAASAVVVQTDASLRCGTMFLPCCKDAPSAHAPGKRASCLARLGIPRLAPQCPRIIAGCTGSVDSSLVADRAAASAIEHDVAARDRLAQQHLPTRKQRLVVIRICCDSAEEAMYAGLAFSVSAGKLDVNTTRESEVEQRSALWLPCRRPG